MTARLTGAVLAAAAFVLTASCATRATGDTAAGTPVGSGTTTPADSDVTCTGFSLSLATDHGGQSSPVAAAEWFAGHGGVPGLPGSGWKEDGQDETGTAVRSGTFTLHAVQVTDATWMVDSGTSC